VQHPQEARGVTTRIPLPMAAPVPRAHVPCTECGRCCTYVGVDIDPPRSLRAASDIVWFLYHDRVSVYRDGDGQWSVAFQTGSRPDPFGARVERLRGDRATADFDRALAGRGFDAVVDFAAFVRAEAERAARVLGGRVGHYVMISSGQVYLVRAGAPSPAREEDYDGPLLPEPPPGTRDHDEWAYGMGK